MDLKISIDTGSIDFEGLSEYFEDAADKAMDELTDDIEWAWRAEVGRTLDESKEKYLEGFTIERNGWEISVRLEGWLPVALERGGKAFDLKPGFLRGHIYRIIPMGHPTVDRFRTVSINSAPDTWWHPGLEGRGIGERVFQQVQDEILPEVFDRVFSSIKL